ncbi:MAG: MFS transporter, partial [Cyanobacteria bacterium J06659_2]
MGVTLIFLAVELLDELIYGVLVGAWPLIAEDLHLSYIQIGLAMTLPSIIASTIEPIVGIWGDIGPRRALILGGGVGFAIALLSNIIRPRDVKWFRRLERPQWLTFEKL